MGAYDILKQQTADMLKQDPRFQFEVVGDWLQKGICPNCGQKELWGSLSKPHKLFCNRKNKCGYIVDVKSQYPQIYNNLRNTVPPTKEDPNSTAKAYMQFVRGLDPEFWKDQFWQGKRWDHEQTFEWPTIRFRLSNGNYVERYIDNPSKKKSIASPYKGAVWKPLKLEVFGDVYITEGVLDAMALNQVGIKAVSSISSGHIPDEFILSHKNHDVTWVIAFDGDKAGVESARKLLRWMNSNNLKSRMVIPPWGMDWNELLLNDRLVETDRWRNRTLEEAEYLGKLALANDPQEYCQFVMQRNGSEYELFEFENATYIGKITKTGEIHVHMIADFAMARLYSKSRPIAKGKSEITHVFKMSPANGKKPVKQVLDAKEITSNQDFKVSAMRYQGLHWSGNQAQLDLIIRRENRKDLELVKQTDIVGYNAESDSYVFSDLAYGPTGQVHKITDEGYYSIGDISIELDGYEPAFPTADSYDPAIWFRPMYGAFGHKALVTLAFYAASFFAEQIFQKVGFFPFLSMFGAPGTGKTTLFKLLHTIFNRDIDEGIATNTSNTAKGELRELAKVSNLPKAILEANEEGSIRFDYNMLLTLYNRNPLQVRAKITNGLETDIMEFLATLVFIQNFEQFKTPAQKQRVISNEFPEKDINDTTLKYLRELEFLKVEELAGMRHLLLQDRMRYLERFFQTFDEFSARLKTDGVKSTRVANNHAVILASMHALGELFFQKQYVSVENDFYKFVLRMVKAKEGNLSEDSDMVTYFFEVMDNLMANSQLKNYSTDNQILAIKYVEFEQRIGEQKISFNKTQLFDELRKSARFIAYKTIKSAEKKSEKCWLFKK